MLDQREAVHLRKIVDGLLQIGRLECGVGDPADLDHEICPCACAEDSPIGVRYFASRSVLLSSARSMKRDLPRSLILLPDSSRSSFRNGVTHRNPSTLDAPPPDWCDIPDAAAAIG